MMNPEASQPTYIHATAVLIGAAGILIRGPSRAGKSSLALALLAESARLSCFARLIGDDRISVERQGENLVLRGHPAIQGKIERRGQGILDVPWEPAAFARYVIDLALPGANPAPPAATTQIEDVELPLLRLAPHLGPAERMTSVMAFIHETGAIPASLPLSRQVNEAPADTELLRCEGLFLNI
jgi:HPr kinase/phosphorylase